LSKWSHGDKGVFGIVCRGLEGETRRQVEQKIRSRLITYAYYIQSSLPSPTVKLCDLSYGYRIYPAVSVALMMYNCYSVALQYTFRLGLRISSIKISFV
jgi:hypothetical protein